MTDPNKNGAEGAGTVTLSKEALGEIVKAAVSEALKASHPYRLEDLERQMATDKAQAEARAAIKPFADIVRAGSKAYGQPLTLTLLSHQAWHEGKRKVLSGTSGGVKVQTRFGDAYGRKNAFWEQLELEATAVALQEKHTKELTSLVRREGRTADPVPVEVALGKMPDDPKRYSTAMHWTPAELLQ